MTNQITIQAENLTVDLILWRRFGVRGRELMEETFRINPAIARSGVFLALGTVLTIPDLPPASATTATAVSLFD